MQSAESLKKIGHWEASLKLVFSFKREKSYLSKRKHYGPFTVQRTLYPEGADCCHAYLLHPPGGLVNGDQLTLDVHCESKSHALITTPSAGKVYACQDEAVTQTQKFCVENDATLEFLPQEMILFNGEKAKLNTRFDLYGNAKMIAFDSVVLGREASKDYFDEGCVTQNIEIYRDDQAVFIERMTFDAQSEFFKASWGLNENRCFSMLLVSGSNTPMLQKVRDKISSENDELISSVTLIKDILVVRILSNHAYLAKELLESIWLLIREDSVQKKSVKPRIWLT